MNRVVYLALVLNGALAQECSSEDSQCDATVMLQSQKQVQAHDMQGGPIEQTFTFKVTPSDYENNVGLTAVIKGLDGNIRADGDLLAFVDDNLQGVQGNTMSTAPNFPGDYAGKKLYDIMVHGNAGDEDKNMTFEFLTHSGGLLYLKPASGMQTVFKADQRGCEKKDDGSIKGVNHINPLVLEVVRDCRGDDATRAEFDAFMTKHFPAYVQYHFTCDQLLAWGNCAMVPGMCDKTCPCP